MKEGQSKDSVGIYLWRRYDENAIFKP